MQTTSSSTLHQKTGRIAGFLMSLADFNANARDSLAGEVGFLGFNEGDNPVFSSVNSEVSRNVSARASNLSAASLAN